MDDATCLQQIQRGGHAAQRGVTELYSRYAPRFFTFLSRRYGFTPEAAEDIVQDAFVKVVRLSGHAPDVTAVPAWLWRIVINTATDALRQQRAVGRHSTQDTALITHQEDDMPTHPIPHPPDMPDPGLVECVRRAFQRFAEDHPERAEALTLLILEGWTAQEVADYLGRTYGATREYLSQCRKALRPYLLQRCGDYLLPNPK